MTNSCRSIGGYLLFATVGKELMLPFQSSSFLFCFLFADNFFSFVKFVINDEGEKIKKRRRLEKSDEGEGVKQSCVVLCNIVLLYYVVLLDMQRDKRFTNVTQTFYLSIVIDGLTGHTDWSPIYFR